MSYERKLGKGTCKKCGKEFTKRAHNAVLCSVICKDNFYGKKATLNIATASVGSISEMMICSEMLARGYSVFRSVSASAFCDVVAIKGSETLLIEVRTGYKNTAGDIGFPKNLHDTIATPTHYGVYVPATKEILIREISANEKVKFSYAKFKEKYL